MRERLKRLIPMHVRNRSHEEDSLSHQIHSALDLPGPYKEPAPLRTLYFDTGRALLDSARPQEAITAFERALQEVRASSSSQVTDWEIYVYQAAAYNKNGNYQAAFHAYLVAVRQEPQHADRILQHAHDILTDSIVRAERRWIQEEWSAIRDQPDIDAIQQAAIDQFLGRVHLRLKHYAQAIPYFEQANQILKDDVRVLEGLGQALWKNGDTKRAVTVLRKAYEAAKSDARGDRLIQTSAKLVQALVADGQFQTALSYIPASITSTTPYAYEFAISRAHCYLALGQAQEALQSAQEAAGYRPAACDPCLLCAQAHIALKQHENAVKDADDGLQRDPARTDTLFYHAQALIEGYLDVEKGRQLLKNYQEDVDHTQLIEWIESAPFAARREDASLHYFLAELYSLRESYSEAQQALERAFELKFSGENAKLEAPALQLKGELLLKSNPEAREQSASIFYDAGVLFYNQEHYKEAAVVLQRALELRPHHALSYLYCSAATLFLASQKEPYERERIEQALKIWDTGYPYGYPANHLSWAYSLRAYSLQTLASMLPSNSPEARSQWWEAVYYMERAHILEPENEMHLSFLSYYYGSLSKFAASVAALHQSASSGKPPSSIQTLGMLAMLEDDRAIEYIDKSRALLTAPDVELEFLAAFLLYQQRDFHGVIKRLDASIQANETFLLSWYLRARAYRKLGQDEQARADFEHIRAVTEAGQPLATENHMQERGDSTYDLGYYEQALEIFETHRAYLISTGSAVVFSSFGLCHMALLHIEEAREYFAKALEYLPSELLRISSAIEDIIELEEVHLKERALEPAVQRVLQPYKETLEQKHQHAVASRRRDPRSELLEAVPEEGLPVGDYGWLAAHAGAARIALSRHEYDAAITAYQTILEQQEHGRSAPFPEARIGLARVYTAQAQALAREQHTEEAIDSLHCSLTLRLAAQQENYAEQMVKDYSKGLSSIQAYLAAAEALYLLSRDASITKQQREDLINAQLNMSREQYYAPLRLPEIIEVGKLTPKFISDGCILVEIASNLVDEHILDQQVIKVDIPAIRERVRKSMGIAIPRVLMRDNPDLPDNSYQIFFYATSYERERVPAGKSFLSSYATILARLEALLYKHLDLLLGVQEVKEMLDMWQGEEEEQKRLLRSALPDDFSLAHLTYVLRGLVKERVPITDVATILTAFKTMQVSADDGGTQTPALDETIESIRRHLKSSLPGNQGGRQWVALSSHFEAAIAQRARHQDGAAFLIVPTEEAEAMLEAVHLSVDGKDTSTMTLIVRQVGLRPLVRRLLAADFPLLAILAEDEVLEPESMRSKELLLIGYNGPDGEDRQRGKIS